jgi:hypothetical protein
VGRRIPSPRRNHFSGPENPIAAPHSFLRAGESHRRAAIFSSGQQISLPRHNIFHRPSNPIAAPQSFIGPANLIAAPQYFPRAGESHRRAAIFSSGRRISSPRRNIFHGPVNPIATPQSFHRAGESHCHATIFSAGRRIPSPRNNHFSGPVNPIAVLHSFQLASGFHRHATIFSAGRKISSSPFCNLFSGLANPIVSGGRRIPSLSRQTSSQPAHHRCACCITAIQSKKPHYH